jgi:hypothetical protein
MVEREREREREGGRKMVQQRRESTAGMLRSIREGEAVEVWTRRAVANLPNIK